MFALLRFRTEVFNTDLLSDQDSKAVHKRADVIKLKGTVQACVIELHTSSEILSEILIMTQKSNSNPS